jgi:hypothetical protein
MIWQSFKVSYSIQQPLASFDALTKKHKALQSDFDNQKANVTALEALKKEQAGIIAGLKSDKEKLEGIDSVLVKIGKVNALNLAIESLKADLKAEQDKYNIHVVEKEKLKAIKKENIKKAAEEQKELEAIKGNQYYQQVVSYASSELYLDSKLSCSKLSDKGLTDADAKAIAVALKTNKAITKLILCKTPLASLLKIQTKLEIVERLALQKHLRLMQPSLIYV